MSDHFVLVHAPVLGPGSWSPVAGELIRRGHRATVPSLTGFTDDGPPYVDRLIQRASAQFSDGQQPTGGQFNDLREPVDRTVLVVHSGAGVFAPYLAEAARAGLVVFADATLPSATLPSAALPSAALPSAALPSAVLPGAPTDQAPADTRVVEAQFLPFLRRIAQDGVVPPWPQWWSAEDLAPLFPDPATRRSVEAEARPLPLAFYAERLPPIPASWRSRCCGYLRFSEGYAEPARQAGARGWPVRELPGEHLHMLVAPVAVATAIIDLAAA